jgi:hypothetical protein
MAVKVTITGYTGLASEPVVVVPLSNQAPQTREPQGGSGNRPALMLIRGDG